MFCKIADGTVCVILGVLQDLFGFDGRFGDQLLLLVGKMRFLGFQILLQILDFLPRPLGFQPFIFKAPAFILQIRDDVLEGFRLVA